MRLLRLTLFAAFLVPLLAPVSPAPASIQILERMKPENEQRRIALVIGNSAYQFHPVIPNPQNDARDVTDALRKLGFEVVLGVDMGRQGFRDSLREFEWRARNADVALFFYAGNGVEVDGKNWLGPVDMQVKSEADIADQMQSLDAILQSMSALAGLKIAIIDACRDNPFLKALRSNSSRSVAGPASRPANGNGVIRTSLARTGLGRVDADRGSLIVMSASPGEVALDGDGRNSPFTTALLAELEKPDLEISLMMQRVVANVVAATKAQQTPWVTASLSREFYFKRSDPAPLPPSGPLQAVPLPPPAPFQAAPISPSTLARAIPVAPFSPPPTPQAAAADEKAEIVWSFIGSIDNVEKLKSFVSTFPASPRIVEANVRIAALEDAQQKKVSTDIAGQKRVALVIGNSTYMHAKTLTNPKRDADRVSAALRRLGFDVRTEFDLDRRHFDEVMPEFSLKAEKADIAVIYYAGHAIQLPDAAYVMPIDANPVSRSHIRHQLKSLRDLVSDLENADGLKLVVIDGCRDNPLAAKLFGILGIPRSTGDQRGFSVNEIEERQVGDLIVAFATLRGEVAFDGKEMNSPFTSAFLSHVEEDGMDVDKLFRAVTDDVKKATNNMQNPEVQMRRTSRPFVLRSAQGAPAAQAKVPK